MLTKKKIIKIIDIMFWGYMIISTFIWIMTDESISLDGMSIEQLTIGQHFLILVVMLFYIFANLFNHFQLAIIYFGIRIAINKLYKRRLDKNDLKKYENYYRDIIKEYSPAVLDYIDDFSINENTVIATVMSLQLKGKIDAKMNIINNDITGLDENEKYIYNNISNLKKINLFKYESLIVDDCKKHKLLKTRQEEKVSLIKWFVILVSFIIISNIINNILIDLANSFGNLIFTIIVFVLNVAPILGIPAIIFSSIAYSTMKSISPYIRSKKAEEINEQMEGLKKYLEDFSIIKDKSKEDLIIWEDYLIYSVIFNQNEKVVKEYKGKIDKL